MLYEEIIQEQTFATIQSKCSRSTNTQLLPFMKEMLDSAILKMNPFDKQKNQRLISQSVYLINKTLLHMYKLNIVETRLLIRKFLRELSVRYEQKKCECTCSNTNPTKLLPFMQEMLDSVLLKLVPNNKQKNQRLISECIYLINKTLTNKLNKFNIQSLIRLFLQELSLCFIKKKDTQNTQNIVPLTKLLPFMQEMLDSVLLKLTNNKQKNKRLISECIYLINKTLVNKLTSYEIKSLIQLFLKELSERFSKQNKHDCIDNDEEHHDYNDTKEDNCEEVDETITCLPIQKPGFFENLTITIPNELCKF
jgi:hypothetical protein